MAIVAPATLLKAVPPLNTSSIGCGMFLPPCTSAPEHELGVMDAARRHQPCPAGCRAAGHIPAGPPRAAVARAAVKEAGTGHVIDGPCAASSGIMRAWTAQGSTCHLLQVPYRR